MGEKDFCFKQGKILSSAAGCKDYTIKMNSELKKRLVLGKRDDREKGAVAQGIEGVTVVERPSGSEGFSLSKEDIIKEKPFIDKMDEDEREEISEEEDFDEGQKLFLVVLLGGLIVLIIVLFIAGVF
jgi:hypothetical protein